MMNDSKVILPQWTPAARIGAGVLGGAALVLSTRLPGRFRPMVRAFGAATLVRALTNRDITDVTEELLDRASQWVSAASKRTARASL